MIFASGVGGLGVQGLCVLGLMVLVSSGNLGFRVFGCRAQSLRFRGFEVSLPPLSRGLGQRLLRRLPLRRLRRQGGTCDPKLGPLDL